MSLMRPHRFTNMSHCITEKNPGIRQIRLPKNNVPYPSTLFLILCLFLIHAFFCDPSRADTLKNLNKQIGSRDAVVVAGPTNDILFSKNAGLKLIPASVLKILTSLTAMHYLGGDYQFKTEFYLDRQSNLIIKGYGDPFLVSEILSGIAKDLSDTVHQVNDIVLDDSYFTQPLTIPGVSRSSQPYDAPNGALCANFNTVNFKRSKTGDLISAEPQTPLLPFAIKKIKKSRARKGRIVLTHKDNEASLYVGQLLAHFLRNEGVSCSGSIRTGTTDPSHDTLIFTYVSSYTLKQLISELLEYSNNFTANQLLISSGAAAFGPPGSLKKGIQAVNAYAKDHLDIERLDIIEGSGISRQNRISANHMIKILFKFKPYSYLMRYEDNEYYKTGTLNGIRTRAGYVEGKNNKLYPFVILLNTPGRSTRGIMKHIMNELAR